MVLLALHGYANDQQRSTMSGYYCGMWAETTWVFNFINHIDKYLANRKGIKIELEDVKKGSLLYFKGYKDVPKSESEAWAKEFEKQLLAGTAERQDDE